jgi:hypothetical protein
MADAVKAYNVHYDIDLFPQPTGMTCWSAAATMVLGNMSVGPGKAALYVEGGLKENPKNIKKFADQYGLVVEYGATWTAKGIADLLRRYGPLWVGGKLPSLHAIVVSGIEGSNDTDATLTIFDPWPPGTPGKGGTIFPAFPLIDFYKQFPEGTDYILHKTRANLELYPRRLPWLG